MATSQAPQNKGGFVENKNKRKNRIQGGGWQAGQSGRGRGRGSSRGQGSRPAETGGRGTSRNNLPHNSAYGGFKPHVTQQTDDMDGHAGCEDHYQEGAEEIGRIGQPQGVGRQGFTFEAPVHVDRRVEVKEVEIKQQGELQLSVSPFGPSMIDFRSKFIDGDEANRIYQRLVEEIDWNRRVIRKPDGGSYEEPRKTFWFGELPYSYSRVTMKSCDQWHPIIEDLKERIKMSTGFTFNSVLCNYYVDAKDGVQWHSDDEYSLGDNPTIASLSLGETRKFQLRKKPFPGASSDEDYLEMEKYFIHLDNGSLLMMTGATQNDWQHRVPKEYHDRGGRINLTFRTIHAENR